MEISEQRPAISDHAPIFEKHTITYSSAMAMSAVWLTLLGLCEGLLTKVAMERVQRTLLTRGREAIHLKRFQLSSTVM
jgi:hypothetical protein